MAQCLSPIRQRKIWCDFGGGLEGFGRILKAKAMQIFHSPKEMRLGSFRAGIGKIDAAKSQGLGL